MTAARAYAYPPALMRVDEAARYCAMSESAFRQHPGKPNPVRPTPKTVAWRRADLDRWIDSLAKDPNASAFDWDSAMEEASCQGGAG